MREPEAEVATHEQQLHTMHQMCQEECGRHEISVTVDGEHCQLEK